MLWTENFVTLKKAMASFIAEYWGFEDLFILHYTGDHSVFQPFEHRNSKRTKKQFIKSAPFCKG